MSGERGIGQRDCGRELKWYKQGLQHGFVLMLRSLGFFLWTMGSHGCLYTSNLHSGEAPGAVVWRMELAAEALEVVDHLSPRNLFSLENATPTHRLRVPPFQLATLKMKPSFPSTGPSVWPGLCPISTGWLSAPPAPGWGLIMHVLLCFIVQICVCDVVGLISKENCVA